MKIEHDFQKLGHSNSNKSFSSDGDIELSKLITSLCETSDIKPLELIEASKTIGESNEMIASLKLERIGIYSNDNDFDPIMQKLLNRITKMAEVDLTNNDSFEGESSNELQSYKTCN
jgi:hypothetical protein